MQTTVEGSVTGWWAVNQLLLGRQEPKWWSSICLLITHLQPLRPPTCSTYLSPHINTPLFPPRLLPPRVSCFTRSPLPPGQVTDFTFLSSPLALPPQFSCLFPSFPAPPLLSSHLLLAQSPENRKGGQLCHNTGSHFFPICSVRKQDWCLWASSGVAAQTKTPSMSGKLHCFSVPSKTLFFFFLITYLCIY